MEGMRRRRRRPDVTSRRRPRGEPAAYMQRVEDWGWDAVLVDGTVVHSWPSRWTKLDGAKHTDEVLRDATRLGNIAEAWCRHYNAGGARRERAMRERDGVHEESR